MLTRNELGSCSAAKFILGQFPETHKASVCAELTTLNKVWRVTLLTSVQLPVPANEQKALYCAEHLQDRNLPQVL